MDWQPSQASGKEMKLIWVQIITDYSMHVKIYELVFILILGLLLGSNDSKKKRLCYIVICSFVFVFIGSMRSPEWMEMQYGIDTMAYNEMYARAQDMSWSEIWFDFKLRYFVGNGDFDIGYTALSKLIGYITDEYCFFSMLADLIFFIALGIMLYRYSTSMKQLMFAFVFYIALIQMYLIGGARQMFAIGFDIMALLALFDKKTIRALIFLLLGIPFHFSSLLFLLPMIMIWADIKPRFLKTLHVLFLLLIPVSLLMPNQVILFLAGLSGVDKYSHYGSQVIQGGAVTYIILIELLSIFCAVAIKRKDLSDDEVLRKFYTMVPFFTFFAPLIRSNGSMDRITLYFYLYIVILIPYALDCMFKKSERGPAYAFTIGALVLLIVLNDQFIYYFFWQR